MNPQDTARRPWERTFEVNEDGLAVLMGWPVQENGSPFAKTLDQRRRDLQEFNVTHKYHMKPGDIDNDLFMVTAELNYPVWKDLTSAKQAQLGTSLERFEEEIRNQAAVTFDLRVEDLWIVKYRRTTMEEVEFAKRVTEVTAEEIRGLY